MGRALASMSHRGPDHRGWRRFELDGARSVTLLHSRLSIIDLDPRANQPFSVDGHHLVTNGELYDYLEVRQRLAAGGERFTTDSDTEVLLRLLRAEGTGALAEREGMWAFAWYDERAGVLRLCRDRFGEKPLYLYQHGEDLYFASEVKLLRALLGGPLRPNHRHLHRYLVNGYKSLYKTGETFFEGVRELPPATVLEVDGAGAREHAYWQPVEGDDPVGERDPGMSFDQAVSDVREALVRAVELRLRADVPLAFLLSGGVDSVALISIARRELGHDVHGFTILNEDARYEEQEMIDVAVRDLAIDHTPIPLDTTDFIPRLRDLVRQHDAPVYTLSHYAHWLVLEQVAAAGYRISISGTGADELFSGYYDHHLAYLAAVADDPQLHASARTAWAEHVRPLVRNPFLVDPDYFLADPHARQHIFLNADHFADYLRCDFDEPFSEAAYDPELLRNRMLNELFHEAVPVILHEEDLNAMSVSVENRSPFLDRSLYELSRRIPTRHLVRDGRAKAVLREAVRGIAPDPIIDNRRKVGFNAPIRSLLDTSDPAVKGQLLADSPVFEHVRRDRIAALLDKEHLPNSESKFLFYFLNAKLFLEEVDP